MVTTFNLVKLPNATAATKTTTTPVTAAALTPKPVAGAAGAAMSGMAPPTTPTTTVTAKTGNPVTASVLSGGKPVVATGQTPPITGQAPQGVQTPVTPSALAPQLSASQNQYMSKFNGGTDGYIQSQLSKYQTAQPDMQAKIAADLQRFGVGVSGANGANNSGAPDWVAASEQDAINQQLAALQGQDASAKLAAQYGVDQNNAYLAEQMQGLQGQQALALHDAQEEQNSRGGAGIYSGGLDWQENNIRSAYASQLGGLTRDIATRNQQLLDQYGTQANTIASQIKDLQTSSPGIIKQKINDYLNNQATLTGNYQGQRTLPGQQFDQGVKNDNLNAALQYGDRSGQLLSAQSNWGNLPNQSRTGVDSNGKPVQQSLDGNQNSFNQGVTMAGLTGTLPNGQKTTQEEQRELENLWTVASQTGTIPNKLADKYGIPRGTSTQDAYQFASQIALQQDANNRAWIDQDFSQSQALNGGTGADGYNGMSQNQLYDAIRSNYTVQDPSTKKNRITADPGKREQMFLDVVDSTQGMSDSQIKQIMTSLGLSSKEISDYTAANGGK